MSALTNAIDLLRCFSTTRPDLSFADVQALTGKPKSSTSRLLRSLRDCGLLEQDPHTRRYRPGLLTSQRDRMPARRSALLRAGSVSGRAAEGGSDRVKGGADGTCESGGSALRMVDSL